MNSKIYNEIKNKFIDIEINRKTSEYVNNKYDLSKYYEIGKLILEAQGGEDKAKYGNYIIKELSDRLTSELGKGYSTRSLKYIRKYYIYQKGQPVVAQLSWTHYIILLSLDNKFIMQYYSDNRILSRKYKIE